MFKIFVVCFGNLYFFKVFEWARHFFFSRSGKKDGRLRLWKFNFETGQLLVVWSGDRLFPGTVCNKTLCQVSDNVR